MTRYLVPSATIGLFYAWLRGTKESETPVTSTKDALQFLKEGKNVKAAIQYITLKHTAGEDANAALEGVDAVTRAFLAQYGSELTNYTDYDRFPQESDEIDFEQLLAKLQLGDDWRSVLSWLNRHSCADDDLACYEIFFPERPTYVERLMRLLRMLLAKVEKTNADVLLQQGLLSTLYLMHIHFRESHPEIAHLVLRILSKFALSSADAAKVLLCSEWLPRLSSMVFERRDLDSKLLVHKICRNALHSLGIIDYKLGADVYEVYVSDMDPVVDIVLIHGLRGGITKTWRQHDSAEPGNNTDNWPKDWLPLDIHTPMRILGVDYPSGFMNLFGRGETVEERASRFRTQLLEAGLGTRPIIFICHSMGGLLAKKLIIDEPKIGENTVGVLFMATPHRGSPLASWGYSILQPTDDVRFLHEQNVKNRELNREFERVSERIPVIVSVAEQKESELVIGTKGIVVPIDSALFGRGPLYHIDDVHHNVCKPLERRSPSYGVVLNFVRDSIKAAKEHKKPSSNM